MDEEIDGSMDRRTDGEGNGFKWINYREGSARGKVSRIALSFQFYIKRMGAYPPPFHTHTLHFDIIN